MAMKDGIVMKGKCIIIPFLLQKQILEQLNSNLICIEKTCLLTHERIIYSDNMNANVEQTLR